MIFPPKDCTMAWKPKQTPSIGNLPANFSISSNEIPASLGVHGPGEITIYLGFNFCISEP